MPVLNFPTPPSGFSTQARGAHSEIIGHDGRVFLADFLMTGSFRLGGFLGYCGLQPLGKKRDILQKYFVLTASEF